jgi:hypothetical protein
MINWHYTPWRAKLGAARQMSRSLIIASSSSAPDVFDGRSKPTRRAARGPCRPSAGYGARTIGVIL